ncbi:MAG: 2'-5' RNA ligase family protein [Halanaerobiaceae bacterium]
MLYLRKNLKGELNISAGTESDELYIVLLPEGEVLEISRRIQKRVVDHYDLYCEEEPPEIHLTLNKIKQEGLNRADEILDKLTSEVSEPIEILIDQLKCLHSSGDKFLVMDVVRTESLESFAYQLHTRLEETGISTLGNYQDWSFHITIISNIFARNPIPDDQLTELCYRLEGFEAPFSAVARWVEIWRPTLDRKNKTTGSYIIE